LSACAGSNLPSTPRPTRARQDIDVDPRRCAGLFAMRVEQTGRQMSRIWTACAIALLLSAASVAAAADRVAWPSNLPVYDHIVIVVEENKDFEQILGGKFDAPYIRKLATEGAVFERMFGEEHFSQGNYFWLFSGSNQNVGFFDRVPSKENHPDYPFKASSLGEQLIKKGLSFKGYAEDLPAIGSTAVVDPPNCVRDACVYARKHVPWISFANVPNGATVETSSNLRFTDFPSDYSKLPTVAFVIPNLDNDMHNGKPAQSIPAGDAWLRRNLDGYYQWAKTHNSLLIITFDENDDKVGYTGLTNPFILLSPANSPRYNQLLLDIQNRTVTIFAGANIKPGRYAEGKGITHVNILRTIEAMYGLPKSGAQQPNAAGGGISDDAIITDVFEPVR
jgi:phosphatidylinositol-3-phosphatase